MAFEFKGLPNWVFWLALGPEILRLLYICIHIYIYISAGTTRAMHEADGTPFEEIPIYSMHGDATPQSTNRAEQMCPGSLSRVPGANRNIYIYICIYMCMLHPSQFPRTASQVIETVWKASQQSDIVSVAFLRYSRFSKPRSSTLLNVKSFDPAAMTCGVDYTYCRVLLRVAKTLRGFDNCV